ncbi:Zn-ribbon domain-containing OB-fold protein [Pseudonocardia acaciae]|uniref:Zn-ribbon domain-containing OB-fold protein n=1 Tax=Pseudonocardia acaciae TaxID=551276 RepID=UPI000490FB33|nr:Zn-ribbon domain-containing OB-fold protein [Pseudonocardia acaciae]
MTETRPLPALDEPDTGRFWQATAGHRLVYRECRACGHVEFFPRRHCTECGGMELDERESAGDGVVYSYTVIRRHQHPYFRARAPYTVGFVDLDEGPRILAEIAGDPDGVRIGQRVAVEWEDHEELAVPIFRSSPPVP